MIFYGNIRFKSEFNDEKSSDVPSLWLFRVIIVLLDSIEAALTIGLKSDSAAEGELFGVNKCGKMTVGRQISNTVWQTRSNKACVNKIILLLFKFDLNCSY